MDMKRKGKLTSHLIFHIGRWIPDKLYLRLLYRLKMHSRLDLEAPKTFNEKLQWLKLNDWQPRYTQMADKKAAKEYVAGIIGEKYIIPTLGCWDRFEDIDFDRLPDQFVLKVTHDSGGLCVCRDKSSFDVEAAKKKIEGALKNDFFLYGRERPYKDIPRKIICEKYMQDGDNLELTDYKFYCFHGEPRFLYLSEGLEDHETAKISFANLDWSFAPFHRMDFAPFQELPPKPDKLEEMIELSRELSRDTLFLRVDLYEINGEVYFGELTFTPCSGFMPFAPREWDAKVGDMLHLPIDK